MLERQNPILNIIYHFLEMLTYICCRERYFLNVRVFYSSEALKSRLLSTGHERPCVTLFITPLLLLFLTISLSLLVFMCLFSFSLLSLIFHCFSNHYFVNGFCYYSILSFLTCILFLSHFQGNPGVRHKGRCWHAPVSCFSL
jgi:hypothetical protein